MAQERGIIFDLDGTLIDSVTMAKRRIIAIARSRHLPITSDIVRKIETLWGRRELIKLLWPKEDSDEFVRIWTEMDYKNPHPALPGIRVALEILDPYFSMSVLTNRFFDATINQLLCAGLFGFFDPLITPDLNGKRKPDPEMIRPLFEHYEKIGIAKERLIFVGDSVADDLNLARAVGIEFYAVLTGINNKKDFLAAGVPPNRILDSIANLPAVLLK